MKLLRRLALHTPQLRAWALYDWANSAFFTVVVTAVFPIYFQDVLAAGLDDAKATGIYGQLTSVALIFAALLSPILGATADAGGTRKRFLAVTMSLGAVATATLGLFGAGAWRPALAAFALANVGVLLSLVLYDSLLPHIAKRDEIDRASTAGYALGYLGGGLLLALVLALILAPQRFGLEDAAAASRVAFFATALWWALFALPLFRWVPEPPRSLEADEQASDRPIRLAFVRLSETLRDLRRLRHTFLLLIAVLVYNDGVTTIYRMATIYGREIGIAQNHLILAILLVQFVGIPFAFLFGQLAGRIGTKQAILVALVVYLGISVFGYSVQTTTQFYVLALAVASVQGGVQGLSRGLFASMVPAHKSSEMFGFFGVAERFSAVLGPFLFGLTAYLTGSSRYAVLSVIVFFVVGGILLLRVDVVAGREAARSLDQGLHVGRREAMP
jgi:UMF1 family MFS transporter